MKESGRHPATISLGFGIGAKPKSGKRRSGGKPPAPAAAKPRVMVVDHDAGMRRTLENRLQGHYLITCAEGAVEALDACVRLRPHLVITELRMSPMDGLDLLKELKGRWPDMTVIILTAHGTIPDAVKATQAGAFGFLVKPVEKDELLGQVRRAIAASNFAADATDWRASLDARARLMQQRLNLANSAAVVNSPLLLTGRHGTGKELLARAVHAASPRRGEPFITLSCVAEPEHRLELLLFGGKDSETGEVFIGAVRQAQHGTLLLDNVEQLPLRLQARLVYEIKDADSIKGLGQTRADVRLICTTGVDLKSEMDNGRLRGDLYYLVSVMPIEVPPLGRRREDLPLLVSHFLEQASDEGTKPLYTPRSIEQLVTTDWPAEVRQLFELVKQGVVLIKESSAETSAVPSYEQARDQFTRDYLVAHLQKTRGNISEAARLAKRNRTDFYKLLARFQVKAEEFKPSKDEVTQKSSPAESS